MRRLLVALTVLTLVFDAIVCPPVTPKKEEEPEKKEEEGDGDGEGDDAFGLEYERYLKEVVSVLESDDEFRKKLEDSNVTDIKLVNQLYYNNYLKEVMSTLVGDDKFLDVVSKYLKNNEHGIKSGEIARHLEFVSHGIRTKLDELKRKEIDRLRQVMKMQQQLQRGMPLGHLPVNPTALVQGFKQMGKDLNMPNVEKERFLAHLDHNNPNTFEVDDLAKLIKQATSDLEDLDKRRREDFKHYELEKERERREHLATLDDEHKKQEEQEHEEALKKHADHPKLHHPGNKEQLEEVWEETDGMDKDNFDPKTFFYMHDSNSDGLLDEQEVEALFQKELDKVYDPNNPEDDMVERDEEMNRMREHVFSEVDQNQDKMITLEEFLQSTNKDEFNKDEDWKTLDEEEPFEDEEIEQYIREYEERQRQELEAAGHPVPVDPSAAPVVKDEALHFQGQGQDHIQGQGHNQGVQHMDQNQPPVPADQQQAQHQADVKHEPIIDAQQQQVQENVNNTLQQQQNVEQQPQVEQVAQQNAQQQEFEQQQQVGQQQQLAEEPKQVVEQSENAQIVEDKVIEGAQQVQVQQEQQDVQQQQQQQHVQQQQDVPVAIEVPAQP